MKKSLLWLLLFPSLGFSQQLADCAPSVPCTTSGPVNTGTGDQPYYAFGKFNANFQSLPTEFFNNLPLSIAHGGTGQITASAALNALLPSQTGYGGDCLGTNGTTPSWVTCGGGGGGSAFSSITGGTNTSAIMVVGSGASLGTTGTGTITANAVVSGINLLTPSNLILTDATGLPLSTGVTGTLGTSNGGTGASSLAAAYIPIWTGSNTTGDCTYWYSATVQGDAGVPCGGEISGTPSSATVLASYPASSNPGKTVQTSDMGTLFSDGTRWNAINPPIPKGAAVLGYTQNVYTVFPTTADITYTTSSPPATRLYSGYGPYGYVPTSASYSTGSNGQLQIQYPSGGGSSPYASLLTTENAVNSQPVSGNLGYLPFLFPGKGFYIEIAVTLSGNNTDNWFAFYLEPQEHNTSQNDKAPNDPTNWERYLEIDVNENGHGTDYSGAYRGAAIAFVGYYSKSCVFSASLSGTSGTIATNGINGSYSTWPSDSGQYTLTTSTSQVLTATFTKGSSAVTWTPTISGSPTATATCGYGKTTINNTETASLDYTTEHIFGVSYDPVGKALTWWQDGVQQNTVSVANISAYINTYHYFPIIAMQSHGSNLAFTGTVRYFAAWTTGTPIQTACIPNEQSGSTYAVASTDNACTIINTNTSGSTDTLPVAGFSSGAFGAGFSTTIQAATGAGTVTIAATSPSTINGSSSITVSAPYACVISDDGSNYFAHCGS